MMVTTCKSGKNKGFFLALLTLTTLSNSKAFAGLPPEAWQIRDAENANFGQVRSEYNHQPMVNYDLARNPYSRVRRVSIFSLYGTPSIYEDRMIGVIGYLEKTSTGDNKFRLQIYPTSESYELGYRRESVTISLNPHFKGIEKFENGNRIEAIGRFKHANQGSIEIPFGLFEDASIRIVTPVRH